MSLRFTRYLVVGVLAAVLAFVFLAYLRPSFLLELGSRLQLC
jgi:putative flippase GtrA